MTAWHVQIADCCMLVDIARRLIGGGYVRWRSFHHQPVSVDRVICHAAEFRQRVSVQIERAWIEIGYVTCVTVKSYIVFIKLSNCFLFLIIDFLLFFILE